MCLEGVAFARRRRLRHFLDYALLALFKIISLPVGHSALSRSLSLSTWYVSALGSCVFMMLQT